MSEKGRTFVWSGSKVVCSAALLSVVILIPAFSGRAGASGFHPRPGWFPVQGSQKTGPQNPFAPASLRQSAAVASAAQRLAQSGVACEPGVPEDGIQACVGKNAGDACTVARDDHGFTGTCATTPGGVLACQPPPPPPPSSGAVAACATLKIGRAHV